MNNSLSTKQKLDKALGLSGGIDDLLKDINDENSALHTAFDDVDEKVKANIDKIDQQISICSDGKGNQLALNNIEAGLNEVSDLISLSKQMIRHVYEATISTDLIDPETIDACAKLIESCRILIDEHMNLYKERMRFYDKIRLSMLQQEQKKELLKYKHELDMAKQNAKCNTSAPANMHSYDQERIIDILDENDNPVPEEQ